MKKLFCVVLYNPRSNQLTRWLISANDDEAAKTEALECTSNQWKIHHCRFICKTDDDVCTEL